jgi:hypothetical protein
VPPAGIFPRLKRAKPYVYSDAEIKALLAAALALPLAILGATDRRQARCWR